MKLTPHIHLSFNGTCEAAFAFYATHLNGQVESSFSRHKRIFGPALRARTWPMQQWECLLGVLTHNLLLVAAA